MVRGSELGGERPLWKRLAKSGAWVALDNVSAALLAFMFFVTTARLLTTEQFGVAALVLSVVQIFQPMIDSLFHDAIVQKEEIVEEDLVTANTFCILWSVFLAGTLWLLSPWIALVLSSPAVQTYLPWMGLSLVFSGCSAVASAEARRSMKFRWLAIRTIVGRSMGTAIGFWLAWQGYGIWSVVLQFVISAGVSAMLLLAGTRVHIGRIAWVRLRRFLAFGAPTMGTQVVLFANSRIMTLMIGGALGPVAAGTWSVAFRFVEPVQTVLATTIGQFSLPIFSRRQADRDTIRHYFSLGTRYTSILLVPAFLGLAVCGRHVITIFVGAKWLAAEPIMQIVCVVTMFLLVRQLAEITLISRGRPGYIFYMHLLGIGLSLVGVYFGISFGLIGAAVGWSARVLSFVTLSAVFIRNELELTIRRQISLASSCISAGLVMFVVLHFLDLRFRTPGSPLGSLMIMSIAGFVIYVGALYAVDREFRKMAASWMAGLNRRPTY
jgi:O-antigen/teichoic acid export membrane protein